MALDLSQTVQFTNSSPAYSCVSLVKIPCKVDPKAIHCLFGPRFVFSLRMFVISVI